MSEAAKVPARRWKRLAIWSAYLLGLWLLVSFLFAYFATRRAHARAAEPIPTLTWGTIESLRLETSDGEDIGAWYIAGRADRPTVLVLHGHRGRRGSCLAQAELFAKAGCPVMLVSFRANGDSTGDYDDIGYGSRHDVIAAVDWLEKNHSPRALVIYGQSMGAASAVYASAELGQRVQGYILESPFQDLRTAVWNRTKQHLPDVLAFVAYTGLVTVSPLVLPDLDRMSPRDAAAGIPGNVPVIILAGSFDDVALPEEARAIHERIRDHAELVFIDGPHGGLQAADPTRYREVLVGFVERIPLQ